MNKYRECPVCISRFGEPFLCDGGSGCMANDDPDPAAKPFRIHPGQPMVHRVCPRCGHFRTDPVSTAPRLASE